MKKIIVSLLLLISFAISSAVAGGFNAGGSMKEKNIDTINPDKPLNTQVASTSGQSKTLTFALGGGFNFGNVMGMGADIRFEMDIKKFVTTLDSLVSANGFGGQLGLGYKVLDVKGFELVPSLFFGMVGYSVYHYYGYDTYLAPSLGLEIDAAYKFNRHLKAGLGMSFGFDFDFGFAYNCKLGVLYIF